MRYHGGKWKIAPWIISHFPSHDVYVEPFGGGASVLMRKHPSRAEVYNDLDGEIVNVFCVLRDREKAAILADMCAFTPYARYEMDLANTESADPIEKARRTLFRAWASFGSSGATRGRTGFRTYTKPDARYTPVTKSWNRMPAAILEFARRLRHVIIENRPAIKVMLQHDTPETLHYVDPPYLPETRTFDGGRYYRCEMTAEEHRGLLEFIQTLQGSVVLSGYKSALYDKALSGWKTVNCQTSGSSRFGSVCRTECLWIKPGSEVGQMAIFQEV